VSSSADAKTSHEYEMMLDIQKNKPVIRKHSTKDANKKGLAVSITLEGDYSKAGSKIRDYVYQTSLITPYATITFDDPKGERFQYKRIVDSMPAPPTIIRPHPHGVDVETLRRMIVDTHYQIPTLDNTMIEKIRKELGLSKKNLNFEGIMVKAEKKWDSLSRPVRVIVALMSFLKMDFEKIMKIRIEDVDLMHKHITYWDFGESKSITIDMPKSSPYYKQLANTVSGETLATFLTKRFQRIGQATAIKFAEFSQLRAEKRIGAFSNEELVQLSDSLQRYEDFLTPDPSCLAPLGEEPLRKGIEQFFNPDFYDVVQRSASAYSGFPFVVEMGIAYGGQIPAGKITTYRFANRIPLLYDEGSDVVLQVVNETDWGRYKIKNDSPLVIVSHICSTRIPYKTVGKENVADRPEIEKELRLALQFLCRKLSAYMSKRGLAEIEKKRTNLYQKYLPLISQFATELSGKTKEPQYKKLIKDLNTSVETQE
jgi:DNA topoisomerase-6 subunit B